MGILPTFCIFLWQSILPVILTIHTLIFSFIFRNKHLSISLTSGLKKALESLFWYSFAKTTADYWWSNDSSPAVKISSIIPSVFSKYKGHIDSLDSFVVRGEWDDEREKNTIRFSTKKDKVTKKIFSCIWIDELL